MASDPPHLLPPDSLLYDALLSRDPAFEGRAYVGVTSTGIVCRLTCPARKPKRENTVFFARLDDALAAGFRSCLRCRPDAADAEHPVVDGLLARLDGRRRFTERDLIAAGLDPSSVRRAFRRRFGATFLALARQRRVSRGLDSIASGGSVIAGQLDAGFRSSSGFRAAVARARPPAWVVDSATVQHRSGPAARGEQDMTDVQANKARRFSALHVKGDPLILYNAWDAGSARAVAEAGASAIATGSWSVAAAQGYPDGEAIPLDLLELIVGRISASVAAPVTVDFEGCYAADPEAAARNAGRILAAGAVGLNVEDGVIGAAVPTLHAVALQGARLSAIRASAEASGVPLFLNARTDLFLQAPPPEHGGLLDAALERAATYAMAGASGFFVPGLADEGLIARLCAGTGLPVNVMMRDGVPPPSRLAALGVARISHGPAPYRAAMAGLRERAAIALRPVR